MTAGIKTGLVGLGLVLAAWIAIAGGRRLLMGTVMGVEAARKAPIPAPALDEPHGTATRETAVFAGGCFWGVQTTFEHMKGVVDATAGYSGGTAATATYAQVSSETTEHAESVKVVFDPAQISYGMLLRVFFSVVLPAARPAMAVLGMLTFLTAWNDFFWPIVALSTQNPTVQVSFQSLATGYAPQQSIIMAGTLYGTLPVLVVFALLGRHIVGGIMQGAVKG